jgi:uncharacterized protein YecT (DUF1311 family)
MHRLALSAAAAAVALAGFATVALGTGGPTPPVIHERFTLLPCPASKPDKSQLELEGCAEHDIVRTDHKIDALAKTVFGLLPDTAARRQFVTAQRAWLAFRTADCLSVSDKYEGGTLAALVDATCTADRSTQHLKELRAFARLLQTP